MNQEREKTVGEAIASKSANPKRTLERAVPPRTRTALGGAAKGMAASQKPLQGKSVTVAQGIKLNKRPQEQKGAPGPIEQKQRVGEKPSTTSPSRPQRSPRPQADAAQRQNVAKQQGRTPSSPQRSQSSPPRQQAPPAGVQQARTAPPAKEDSLEKASKDQKRQNEGMFMRIPPKRHDLVTDIRATIQQQSPKGGHYIIWATLAFFIVFCIWSYFSEIEQVVRANGKVVPSSQIQVVQNLEGGIVSEIDAHVGDIVERGQLLLKIDKTRFDASYKESQASFLALTAKVTRLEAEVQEKKFVVPEVVKEENPEIGRREEELYRSRMRALENSQQILKEKLSQKKQELSEMQARQQELTRSSKLLQQEISMTEPLVKQGAVSRVEILRLHRQASQMDGDIESARLNIPRLRSQVKEAQKAIEDGRLEYINRAREELNKVYTDLESISASSVALVDRLDRTQVRSPVKGTVNRLLVNTVGGIIQPGMDLVEIVPLEDTLLVEARVKPQDIAFLRPDQKAKVKFSAYDFTVYGGLDAKLEQISADSLTDDAGEDYYLVRLRTDKNYLGTEQHPLPIIPGMLVTVDIISGKTSVLAYLAKPILRAKKLALREM